MTHTPDHQVLDPAQSRPRLRTDLVVLPYDSESFVIEDPLAGKFYLVGAKEWSFISQLDGADTISAAVGQSASQMGSQALSEQEAISVARWLVDHHLARPAENVAGPVAKSAAKGTKRPLAFNPLSIRWAVGNPDRLLTMVSAHFDWLWSQWFVAVWMGLAVLAIVKIASHAGEISALPRHVLDSHNWWRLIVVWCVLKFIHEMGHGLACKHFGVHVRRAGIMFLLLAPLPYVDVSAAWRLSSAWKRIVISAAGMYVEILLASLCILCWTPGSLALFDRLCVEVAILAGVHTVLFNANPLMRFDGYYILADSLGIPNLYSEGQQRVTVWARHWFCGVDVSAPPVPPFQKSATFTYGALALWWRCLSFAGMAIGLVATWAWWGVPLVGLLWCYWFGIPFRGKKKRGAEAGTRSSAARRRQIIAWGSALATAGTIVAWAFSPAHVTAPAVVEYAPLTVLRAKASGFVKTVHVQDGQTVEAGDLLLELTNDDLAAELQGVEIGIQQSLVRSRWHFLQGELSKHQAELAVAGSLERRKAELTAQLEALQVRAPGKATIVSRGVAALAGSYVEQGAALVSLASDNEKEVLVSVAASDADDFLSQTDESVSVFRDFVGASCATGKLAQMEPRASEHLPHVALGADFGGPVPVRPDVDAAAQGSPAGYLALSPRFVAKVSLDEAASRRLSAGERVTVGLRRASQSWGGRILALCRDYLNQVAAEAKAASDASKRT